ncbi:hypothetical protein PCC6311_2229 [Synechococcus elongatus PCC 6311]|nr:hypothetical protein M744_05625 [Synechococcus elongatus UTEX 2973]UOW71973.1 hypothetical protein PCC7943_2231 [Synechococcus elongatus PCC 7943]UOW74692.1 hypothetical protein PCC6311_2229 [Synechococcus elongatus PCC 6311]UOW77413.1 hypothetical protein PCC6301pg_2231 [Synechococcus elongatus PCC 6301]
MEVVGVPSRASRLISVRLDEQTDAVLQAYCQRTGVTQTEAIKAGIQKLTAPMNSPATLAEQLGLVGCFESGVGDLGQHHAQHLKDKLALRHAQSQQFNV